MVKNNSVLTASSGNEIELSGFKSRKMEKIDEDSDELDRDDNSIHLSKLDIKGKKITKRETPQAKVEQ